MKRGSSDDVVSVIIIRIQKLVTVRNKIQKEITRLNAMLKDVDHG